MGPVEVSGAEPHGQTPNQECVGAEGVRTLGDVPVTDTWSPSVSPDVDCGLGETAVSRCKFMGYDDRTPPVAGGYDNAEAAAGARGTLCVPHTANPKLLLKKVLFKSLKKIFRSNK